MSSATATEVKSTTEWQAVIGNLTTKKQTAASQLAELQRQKRDLALEAAMGSANAAKRLREINGEIARQALDLDSLETALAQAGTEKQSASKAEAAHAEQQRRKEIAADLTRYLEHVREIDDTLQALASQFAAAKQSLDRAEARMTGQECDNLRQLRSKFAPTLAAAHCGLGEYVELGQSAGHISHRKPLTASAQPYVGSWMEKEE